MWGLVAALVCGCLGAGHCVAMCGPFVWVVAEASRHIWDNVARQVAYSIGRITTYSFMGALAAWSMAHVEKLTFLSGIPLVLSVVAGLSLWCAAGIQLTPAATWVRLAVPVCPFGLSVRGVARLGGYWSAVATGAITAWIPCGLVYGMAAAAATTAHPAWGAAMMGAFGLGTSLPLVVLGIGGAWLQRLWRGRVRLAAALSLALAGTVCLIRALPTLWNATPTCPACAKPAAPSTLPQHDRSHRSSVNIRSPTFLFFHGNDRMDYRRVAEGANPNRDQHLPGKNLATFAGENRGMRPADEQPLLPERRTGTSHPCPVASGTDHRKTLGGISFAAYTDALTAPMRLYRELESHRRWARQTRTARKAVPGSLYRQHDCTKSTTPIMV